MEAAGVVDEKPALQWRSLWVERVVNVLPHEHFTVASVYSGWMSAFIASP